MFKFLREGLQRYPKGRMRFPDAPPATPSHPHLVEIMVPSWTWAADVDFQRWLFGFGSGVRMEAPAGLVELHQQKAREVLEVYGSDGED